jgi:hypothetical protein
MEVGHIKWIFIAMMVVISAPLVTGAVKDINTTNAKRDIIVACYQSGRQNCDVLWNKVIK